MTQKKTKKFSLPKRKFCDGDKKMVSIRLPVNLVEELERVARDRQWAVSDVIMTALDEFAQWSQKGN